MDSLGSQNIECRQDGSRISGERERWLFNTKFSGIDESDGCLLIGTNPRFEAALINSRLLRKSKENDYSIGLLGKENDLNYDYDFLGDDPSIIKELIDGTHVFCSKLESMSRPIMIIGQGAIIGDSGEDFLNLTIKLANKYNFLSSNWNGFNVLHNAASRPGAMEIGFLPGPEGRNLDQIIEGCNNGQISTLFLLGADEVFLNEDSNCFVIYQGHHGDNGAHQADLVLPSPSFNEQNGLFINTEGRVQESVRATFPVGSAKEDWEIISIIAKEMNLDFQINNFDELRDEIFSLFPELSNIDDINVGILYLFAVSSLGVYGIIMGGWASNSKYPFLGAIRSAAQMVSYEVSIGVIIINVLLCVGSLNLNDIVEAQQNLWFVIPLFPMFVIFFISALAETNRPPFDLPEAEAELVAGYQTEYSGMMYAMFWLGEYANIF